MADDDHSGGFLEAMGDRPLENKQREQAADAHDPRTASSGGEEYGEEMDTLMGAPAPDPEEKEQTEHPGPSPNTVTVVSALVAACVIAVAFVVVGVFRSLKPSRQSRNADEETVLDTGSTGTGTSESLADVDASSRSALSPVGPAGVASASAKATGFFSVRLGDYSPENRRVAEGKAKALQARDFPAVLYKDRVRDIIVLYVGRYETSEKSWQVTQTLAAVDLDGDGQPDWPEAYPVMRRLAN